MSVPGIGYVVHNKARVALERALRNPRKRVLGVDRELKSTFRFSPQGVGVGGLSPRDQLTLTLRQLLLHACEKFLFVIWGVTGLQLKVLRDQTNGHTHHGVPGDPFFL